MLHAHRKNKKKNKMAARLVACYPIALVALAFKLFT